MPNTHDANNTTPSDATVSAEEPEAHRAHVADRAPTDEETDDAARAPKDPEAAKHYREMAKRGANQQGEGRVP